MRNWCWSFCPNKDKPQSAKRARLNPENTGVERCHTRAKHLWKKQKEKTNTGWSLGVWKRLASFPLTEIIDEIHCSKFNKVLFLGEGRGGLFIEGKKERSRLNSCSWFKKEGQILGISFQGQKSLVATQKMWCYACTLVYLLILFFFFFNGIRYVPFFLLSLIIPGAPRKAYLSQLCNPQKQSSWLTPNGSVWRRRWHKAALPAPYPSGWVAAVVDVCVGKVFFPFSFFFFSCTFNTLQGPIRLPRKWSWHPLELFHCHWLNLMLFCHAEWFHLKMPN